MAKPIPGRVRLVWTPRQKGTRWQVVCQTVDGAKHSRTFASEDLAEEWADQQRAEIAGAAAGSVPENIGSPRWWRDSASHVAHLIRCGIDDGSVDLLQGARVMASLVAAGAKHSADAELDEAIAELQEKERQRKAMKKHGPRSQRQAVPTTTPPTPGQPFYGKANQ